MHWAYYLLIAAAVIVLLNIALVMYMAIASREQQAHGRSDRTPFNET